jgi:hypothetical protein
MTTNRSMGVPSTSVSLQSGSAKAAPTEKQDKSRSNLLDLRSRVKIKEKNTKQ